MFNVRWLPSPWDAETATGRRSAATGPLRTILCCTSRRPSGGLADRMGGMDGDTDRLHGKQDSLAVCTDGLPTASTHPEGGMEGYTSYTAALRRRVVERRAGLRDPRGNRAPRG